MATYVVGMSDTSDLDTLVNRHGGNIEQLLHQQLEQSKKMAEHLKLLAFAGALWVVLVLVGVLGWATLYMGS